MKFYFPTFLKRSSLWQILLVCLLGSFGNWLSAQSYLGLDGGFEGSATIDNTNIQTAAQAGQWSKSNASQTIANETSTVRSGANALRVNNTSTTGRRVWSPNFTVSSTTSSVTIQLYRRVASTTNSQDEQRGVHNNNEGLSGSYSVPSAANTWEKVTYNKTSSTYTSVAGLFLTRQFGTGGNMFIDDVAVYAGAVDNTAPNSPGTLTVSGATTSSLNLSWGAASGGVDNGGYMVVRYTSNPAAADDPNVNGIYATGNTIPGTVNGTVVYVGTATTFTSNGLSSATQYFYKLYTYDKAYNYSSEVTGNGTTLGPVILTTGTLSALSTTYGTASSNTSFDVSGTDMQAGITVTPPAGFEVSTDNTNFSNTVTVGAAGTISSTPVYIRLKSSATPVGSPYSGNIVLSSTNATSVNVATASSTVAQKNLTITGVTANNKTYDGTTAATLSGTPSLVGIVGSDDVSVSGTPTATFASANAGMGIAVSVSGYTLAGTNAGNYTLSQPTGLTADINKASQTITFGALAPKSVNAPDFMLTATASSGLTVTYTSSDPTVAAIVSGNMVDLLMVGTTNITASQAGDANYLPASDVMQTQDVNALQNQTITFNALADVTYGDADFALTATASSGLTVTYTSSDPSVATVSGNIVTIVGAGTTTITASQAGDMDYNAAPDVQQNLTVLPKNLTVSGATADNKIYDRTTAATISGASLVGIVGSEDVSIATSTGTFSDKNVGTGKAVTATLTLGGVDAANYTLTQPTGLTANISQKNLTVTGATAQNKIYDATTAATITGASLSGVVSGDVVTVGGGGTFADKNIGTGKAVTAALTLGGADGGNYSLTQPTGLTANISAKNLTATGATAQNKIYDATTAAVITGASLSGVVSGDDVSIATSTGTFSSKTVANGKSVTAALTLGGTDAGNYTLTQPTGLTANITKKTITVTGITANNKVYNGSTAATLSGTAVLSGVETGDVVNLGSTPTAIFASANVGIGIAVTVSGYTISGTDAGNYSLSQPSGLTADITKADQTITFNALPTKLETDPNFNLGATASSGLTVTYVSSNTAVATISGSTVDIVGVGMTTITASQAGDGNYNAATPVDQTLTVQAALAAWDFNGNAGDETTVNATAHNVKVNTPVIARGSGLSGAALANIYNSSSFNVGTSSASAAASANDFVYFSIQAQSGYQVSLSSLNANFRRSSSGPNNFQWEYSTNGTTYTSLGSSISFTSTASDGVAQSPISLTGISALQGTPQVTLRLLGWGATNIGGTFGIGRLTGNDLVVVGEVSCLTPAAFNVTGGGSYCSGGSGVEVGLSGSQNGIIYQLLLDNVEVSTPVTGTGSAISFGLQTALGVYTVKAKNLIDACNVETLQSGSATVSISAPPAAPTGNALQTFLINQNAKVSDLVAVGSNIKWYDAASGGNLLANTTVLVDGNIYYASQTISACESTDRLAVTVDLAQVPQTITFGALPTITDYVSSFNLTATASSGLTVSFSSSNTSVATISGSTVTIVGSGTTTITASQVGNATYLAAPNVDQTLNVLDALAAWNFATANPSTAAVTNLTVSAVSQGNNNVSSGNPVLLSTTSASTGYIGVSGTNNAGIAARTGSLNTATNGSAYFQFSLTPATAYKAVLTGIVFGSRSTGTGPLAYTLRSSLDNYTADIATGTLTNDGVWTLEFNHPFSVESATSTAITFRLFGHSGTGSPSAGTANWRIDDLQLVGSVECGIPNPTAFTVTGGGTYCAGGAGLPIGLSNSQLNTIYQLLLDGSTVGSTVAGTGMALDFGLQTAAGTYSVAATNLCSNVTTTTANATITITPLPNAPTGSATQNFCSTENAKVSNLVASGSNIQWYDAATGGNLLAPMTALVNGNHYFASQTVSTCEGTARLDVTATITVATTYYLDSDNDGFGDPTTTTLACSLPMGYSANDDDCDDTDDMVFPGAMETCNNVDDDCDNVVDNGFSQVNFTSVVVGEGCGGGTMNGSIDLTLTGGLAPISYSWSNSAMSEDLSGLSAGAYSVTVSGGGGCTKTGSFTVVLNTAPPLGVTFSVAHVTCNGSANGTIFSTPTGGTTPYAYLWTPTGKTTKNINLLPAGTHTLRLSDAAGCFLMSSAVVNEPTPVNFTLASSPAPAPYTITVTASGGTPGTGYTYNRSPFTTFQPSNVFAGVANGTYIFKVKDANGCQKSRIIKVPLVGPKPPKPGDLPIGNANGDLPLPGADPEFLEIFVFPNPATSEVQFEILHKNFAEGQLKISDLTGRILMEKPVLLFENQPVSMDVSNLREGFYQMILVETDGRTTAQNFVIQR